MYFQTYFGLNVCLQTSKRVLNACKVCYGALHPRGPPHISYLLPLLRHYRQASINAQLRIRQLGFQFKQSIKKFLRHWFWVNDIKDPCCV